MSEIGFGNRPSAPKAKAPKVSKAEQESRDAFRSGVRTGAPGAGKSPTSGLRARRPQVAQRLDSLAGAGTIARREDLVAAADSLTTLGRSNPQMADGVASALLRKDIDVRSAIAMSEALAKSPALAFMAVAHQDNLLPLLNVARESAPPSKLAQRLARLAEERPDLAGALVNAAAAANTPPKSVELIARRLLKSPNLASTLEQMSRDDLHRLTTKVVAAADGPQTLRRLADLGENHPGALSALAGALAIDKGVAGGKQYRALAAKILDDKSAAVALDNVALSTPDHGAALATSLLRAGKPGEALHAVGADPDVAARMSDLAVRNPAAAVALMDGVRGLEPIRAAETLRRCASEPAMADLVVRDPRTFARLVERFDFSRPDAVNVARDPKTYAALVGVLDSNPVIGYGSVAQQIGVVVGVTEARRLFGSGPKAIRLENALLATAVADPGFAREAAANPRRAADALRAAQALPGYPAGLEATPTAEQAEAIRKSVAPLGFDHPTQSLGTPQANRVRQAAGAVLRFVRLPEPRANTDASVGFHAMASLGKALRVGTLDASRVETLRDAAETNLGVAHAVGGLKPKQVGALAAGLRCVRAVSGDEGMRDYAAKLGTERGSTAEATLAVGKEMPVAGPATPVGPVVGGTVPAPPPPPNVFGNGPAFGVAPPATVGAPPPPVNVFGGNTPPAMGGPSTAPRLTAPPQPPISIPQPTPAPTAPTAPTATAPALTPAPVPVQVAPPAFEVPGARAVEAPVIPKASVSLDKLFKKPAPAPEQPKVEAKPEPKPEAAKPAEAPKPEPVKDAAPEPPKADAPKAEAAPKPAAADEKPQGTEASGG